MSAVSYGPRRKSFGHEHGAAAKHIDEIFPCSDRGLGSIRNFFAVIGDKSGCAQNGEGVSNIEMWNAVPESSLCYTQKLHTAGIIAHLWCIFNKISIGSSRGVGDTRLASREPFFDV